MEQRSQGKPVVIMVVEQDGRSWMVEVEDGEGRGSARFDGGRSAEAALGAARQLASQYEAAGRRVTVAMGECWIWETAGTGADPDPEVEIDDAPTLVSEPIFEIEAEEPDLPRAFGVSGTIVCACPPPPAPGPRPVRVQTENRLTDLAAELEKRLDAEPTLLAQYTRIRARALLAQSLAFQSAHQAELIAAGFLAAHARRRAP